MPPKKKRRVPPPSQPGVARKYITEHFKDWQGGPLKNGHVLYHYYENQKSVTKTVSSVNESRGATSVVPSRVVSLVSNSIDYYKHLSNENEMEKLRSICEEDFPLADVPSQSVPGTPHQFSPVSDAETPHQSTSVPDSSDAVKCTPHDQATCSLSPSSTVRSSKRKMEILTPRKVQLKKRLDFVSASKSDMRKKYQETVKTLKKKLRTPKRVTNQALKRKAKLIDKLKGKLENNSLSVELAETKLELDRLRNAHNKLLAYNKSKKAVTVPATRYRFLQARLKKSNETVRELENDKIVLQEKIEDLTTSSKSMNLKADVKTYSSMTRMMVFDHIVNQVPTTNIPTLIHQSQIRAGKVPENIPQRSTVELMARELGAISELQTATLILENENVTLGFDATTQEGVHVNSIHFTTQSDCYAAAVEALPGGTAEDYADHICDTVDSLSRTYAHFNDTDIQETKKKIIANITNTMSDRCAANRAALRIVSSEWKKSLNELNFHLHPLDSFASSTRAALKKLEDCRGKVFGKDCMAAHLVLQINKLRYKDGKGDPRGFVAFLDKHQLPRGILPRYRGNRLHVLYHICGVLVEHHELFVELFECGTSCGTLRRGILEDFTNDVAKMELYVLGLIGKVLSAPWMKKFYTSSETEMNHVEGIQVVREVLERLKLAADDPENLLTTTVDLFGDELPVDSTLSTLRGLRDTESYSTMMKACLLAVIDVIERQYSRYFSWDIDEKLKEETKSARSHNIDAEEIMGMFSSAQKRAPNATMCFLSCRMRSKKNKTVSYLDGLDEDTREQIVRKAVSFGRQQRDSRSKRQKELRSGIIRRPDEKKQKKDESQRRDLEKQLRQGLLENVLKDFPYISDSDELFLKDILEGKAVGRTIVHVWCEEGSLVSYYGKLEKFRKSKHYKVAYWTQSEDYDDATDFEMSMYALAADLLHEDLVLLN